MFVTKANAEEAKPAAGTPEAGATPAAEATHGAAGETHNTETGVAHEGEHGGVFPPFDTTSFASQLLWLAITFGLFYLFISRVASPRIGGILEARKDRIARDLAEAAKAKEEADAAVAAYETDLATARKNALDIGNKARDAAKAKAEADRKAAEAGLDGMLKSAESRISDLRASGMKEVGKIAEDTASAILTQLTGGKFSASEIANAIKTVKG